jgi:hypothetical protein
MLSGYMEQSEHTNLGSQNQIPQFNLVVTSRSYLTVYTPGSQARFRATPINHAGTVILQSHQKHRITLYNGQRASLANNIALSIDNYTNF